MKLQILVPQYKETDEVIKPLLDSLLVQQNVDLKNEVGVIICNDGSDTFLSDKLLNSYPFKIEYHKEPHRGVSGTRNACLDYSTSEYVMWCDADDMFFNACGLWMIFREMQGSGFNSLSSTFIEETRFNGEPLYINREQDVTFVHGKVHKRQFLIDNDLRWNEKLTIHEDSYFNILCQTTAGNVKYLSDSFYLWKWRDDSVCRHDPKYILKTYNNMLDSNTALIEEFLRRSKKDLAKYYSTSMIYDAYFTLNKKEWIEQENQEYRKAVEDRFYKYFKQFRYLFDDTNEMIKNQIIVGIKNRMFGEGMFLESITFNDWISKFNE